MDLPVNVDNTEEFRCISLCSGYGGLELGLRRVVPNLRTVAYVEIEAFACANLVAKIEAGLLDAAPVWTDIKTFNGALFRSRVHIVTAGYPCQPFSVAGKRKGTDDPRHLWPHIERIIEAVRPVWFFGENVSGHLGIGFAEVYRSLRNLGYEVEAGLFTAAEVGAPHKRERLFILAQSQTAERGWLQKKYSGRGIKKIGRPNGSELENTTSGKRHQGISANFWAQRTNEKSSTRISESSNCWPSRLGQPQYEWEEPRVVVNAKSNRNGRRSEEIQQEDGGQKPELCGNIEGPSKVSRQTKPRLGRATNGTSCRVDSNKGINNETMPNMSETNKKQGLEKGKVLQSELLCQVDNAQESIESSKSQAGSKSNSQNKMRAMSRNKECATASSRLEQASGSDITMSEMSYSRRNETRTVGQQENSMRIDRLRLLGNGVVPQQVEKAFRNLIS